MRRLESGLPFCDTELKERAIKIISASNSAAEAKERARNELGIYLTITAFAQGSCLARELAHLIGGVVMGSGELVTASFSGNNGMIQI